MFTFLSLLISCPGILGLTALSVAQRTKEIGLRKIAGASVSSIIWRVLHIMFHLNGGFLRLQG